MRSCLPWRSGFSETPVAVKMDSGGLTSVRLWLFFGCIACAGLHAAICYGIHANMVRTFDMTVRRLAGNK